ncbi:MAG: phenylalanine--tRNA ligase subunit beta, partial [Actinomycetota bacterium]|nr:phenylalanine--tRNA ligase subunit beta [Actinomycetota bacterium]
VLAGHPATDATRVWTTLVEAMGLVPIALVPAAPPGLHPTRSAELVAGSTTIGALGEIDPDVLAVHGLAGPVAVLHLDLGALLASPRRPRIYRPVSRYPSADIDLAFVVHDSAAAGSVADALRAAGGGAVEDLWLFDVFRGPQLGEGCRSLAFRLRFSAIDHTLAEDELTALRGRCIEAVESAFGARLRG